MMQQVTVRVPASTSNLGPGFDCLGVALRIYNRVTVARSGAASVSPLARQAARLFFKAARIRPFAFACSVTDHIPRARGLGSSATVRAGLLLALNRIAGDPLERPAIFELCAELEGHPDNCAPALFGGFTVVRGGQVQRFDVSSRLRFVLFVPEIEIKTPAARKILPAMIKRLDAVESCGNACAITAAFASRNYQALRGAFADELHQPFRRKLIPFLPRIIAAAEKAGALGAFLSGSGSTIAAVTLESPKKILTAMLATARSKDARVFITTADNHGAEVVINPKSKIQNRK
jgi:homoserine kinase